MNEQHSRGSSMLWKEVFREQAPLDEALQAAMQAAGDEYKILRWWKYGQPAIDQIKATLDVPVELAGRVIHELITSQGAELQVNLEVFPYGTPNPDGVHLHVLLERNLG